jgi:hypothetical protein
MNKYELIKGITPDISDAELLKVVVALLGCEYAAMETAEPETEKINFPITSFLRVLPKVLMSVAVAEQGDIMRKTDSSLSEYAAELNFRDALEQISTDHSTEEADDLTYLAIQRLMMTAFFIGLGWDKADHYIVHQKIKDTPSGTPGVETWLEDPRGQQGEVP